MNSPQYLDQTIRDIESDMGLELVVTETTEQETVEVAQSWNGDSVGYSNMPVLNVTAQAHGFIWHHPYSATIRGSFAQPIELANAVLDDDGGELDYTSNANAVARAVVAKLGNVAELDEVLLGMARA